LLHTYPVPRGRASRRLDDRYDSREVDSFWDRYITKDAAITLLDQPPLTFERWLQQGVLPIADGGGVGHEPFLFDREALVQWRQERLTSAEAMRLLGFNHGTMRHWVGTGKLRPIPGMGERRQWFWRAEVEEWAGDRITAAQAGELIGIPAITVNRWSRIGKLPMAEHAGQDHRLWFSRRAILEWRNERLTIEEAATLCRVHPASVLHWEERGHITRITPPTHRPVWFARADIERWMAERVELARNNGRYRSRGTGSVSETISQASP
jgi:predicted site-specific integrase-resolvase